MGRIGGIFSKLWVGVLTIKEYHHYPVVLAALRAWNAVERSTAFKMSANERPCGMDFVEFITK